jgi:hypothetical protein
MNKELTTVIARATIQVLSGWLLKKGIEVDDGNIELLVGAVVFVASIVWSVKEKAKIKSDTVTIPKP